MNVSRGGRPLPGISSGSDEPIFDRLPANVLDNLRHPHSENALLWNTVYPRLGNSLTLRQLLELKPLWGSAGVSGGDQPLTPYFWGYGTGGETAPYLRQALAQVDGPGPATEIDLMLMDDRHLVVAEVKHGSGLGRCSRYQQSACPTAHPDLAAKHACRYWDPGEFRFDHMLDWPGPPAPTETSQCARHYQLGRTLLVGQALAKLLDRQLSLWLIVPRAGWRRLERAWLEFTEAVLDHQMWKRMRVLSWASIQRLPA